MKFKEYSITYPKDILVKIFYDSSKSIYNVYFFNVKGAYNKLVLKNIFFLEHDKVSRVLTFKLNKTFVDLKLLRTLWKTYQILITNAIKDLSYGYTTILELRGVGFKSEIKENELILFLGFSHTINFKIPADIEITHVNNTNTIVSITGYNRCKVQEIAATIRNFKLPEPYKGKGVCYYGEVINLKESKKEQ